MLNNTFTHQLREDQMLVIQDDATSVMGSASIDGASQHCSLVSELTMETASNRSQQLTEKTHCLALSDDVVTHSVGRGTKKRIGKRKRRGKCLLCGQNTRYYCTGCQPTNKRKREWCYSDDNGQQCLTKHINDMRNRKNVTYPAP